MSDKATLRRLLREIDDARRTEEIVIAEEAILKLFDTVRDELEAEKNALLARAERAEAAEKALLMSEAALKKWQSATCHWSCPEPEDDAYWETDCGLVWEFQEGGPRENDVRFCPKCGRRLVVDEPPAHDAGKDER